MASTILDQYIDRNPNALEAIKRRYREGVTKTAEFYAAELQRLLETSPSGERIRYRESESSSLRSSGEYIQIAYAISIRLPDGTWKAIDTGKHSLKREFDIFVRKALVIDDVDAVAQFAAGLIKPKKSREEPDMSILISSGWFTVDKDD